MMETYEYTAEEMADYDQLYNDAEVNDGQDYDPVPEGTYTVRVDKAELRHNKYLECPELSLTLVIVGGPHNNRKLWSQNTYTDKGITFLKTTLARLGLDIAPSEIINRLPDFLDLCCEVAVKHKKKDDKTYVNTYINRKVDAPPFCEGAHTGDEMPF